MIKTAQKEHSTDFVHITTIGEYKPGDLPPAGYLDWHEWAEVQYKAGIKQSQCSDCGKWVTPQETAQEGTKALCNSKGQPVEVATRVCIYCKPIASPSDKSGGAL